MLGHWKNYDELEESLSVDELLITVNALREREDRERQFLAALQGIDLNESEGSESESDGDIVDLTGYAASQAGFGINMGIGHMEIGEE